MGQDEADEQCLLLARRAAFGLHVLFAVTNEEVGTVGTFERAAGGSIPVTTVLQQAEIDILDLVGWALPFLV